MELQFLPLTTGHLDAVLAIEQVSFPQPWTRGMFEREIALPISHFFVAADGDAVVGYGGYWQVEEEASLTNLAVHPAFRNRGLGRRLLAYLVDRMADGKAAKILLEVRESNVPAQKLYMAFGFKAVGYRPKYYINEGAVLMERVLEMK